jgi:hypothetical protein
MTASGLASRPAPKNRLPRQRLVMPIDHRRLEQWATALGTQRYRKRSDRYNRSAMKRLDFAGSARTAPVCSARRRSAILT